MKERLTYTLLATIASLSMATAQYKALPLDRARAFKNAVSHPTSLVPEPARLTAEPADSALSQARRHNVAKRMPAGPAPSSLLVIDDGTRIRGAVQLTGSAEVQGMADLRPVSGTWPEILGNTIPGSDLAACDGKYYYSKTYVSGGGQVLEAHFYVTDASTFQVVTHVDMPESWASVDQILAYNPHDGEVWALAYDGFRRPYLATVDKATGEHNYVSQQPFTTQLMGMTFSADGRLYGITQAGEFVEINLATGEPTVISTVSSELGYHATLAYDYHTDKIYWSSLSAEFHNALRSIDVATGECEVVSTLPDYFSMEGTTVISPQAPAKAPDTVAGLVVDFQSEGAFQGTVSITAPTRCFDGSALSGELTMQLYVDGSLVETRQQTAGSTIAIGHDFDSQGEHPVAVVYKNENGESPRGLITVYCGKDVPADVSGLSLTSDDQTGVVTLTWDAVTSGIHAGYMPAGEVTYTVVRLPDNKEVAKGLTATTCTDQLPADIDPRRYSYQVSAQALGMSGDVSQTRDIVFGRPLQTPLKEQLGSEYFSELMMTDNFDGHGDGYYFGWGVAFVNGGWSEEGFKNDKWLYTPAIHLEKGNYYYRLQHEDGGYDLYYGLQRQPGSQHEHHIGTIGTGVNEDDYTTADDDLYNGSYTHFITYKKLIEVKEEGDYYFGFHFDKEYPGSEFGNSAMLRTFEVKKGPEYIAPMECTDISALTFEKGVLKNHITFTAPTKDYQGNTLTGKLKVEFYLSTQKQDPSGRTLVSNELVYTLEDVEPGQTYTADVPAHQGVNIYYFYACNENGQGGENEVTVWAGIDYPTYVNNANYEVIENRDIYMTWDAPDEIGMNGGYVDLEKVTYNAGVCENPLTGLVTLDGMGNLKERHYTFYGELGPQYRFYYGVKPVSELGEGLELMAPIVVGTPYTAPFRESFNTVGGSISTGFWDLLQQQGEHSWAVSRTSPDGSFDPYDADDGMMIFSHEGDVLSAEILQTPVMAITGVKKPVLSFWFYHNPTNRDEYAGLTVYPVVSDNVMDPIASIGLYGAERGWKHYELPLDKFMGEERVYFYLFGSNSKSASVLGLDAVEVYDNIPVDLALETLTTPSKVNPNEDNYISVGVQNRGRQTLGSYRLGLYADGRLVQEQEGRDLAFGDRSTVTFRFQPEPVFFGRRVSYEVRVLVDDDANEGNDVLSREVSVGTTMLPAPGALALSEGEGTVTLQWTAPVEPEWSEVREDFESYEPFIIEDIGPWTTVDADGKLSNAPNSGSGTAAEFANNWCAKGFQVWNPTGLTLVAQLQGNAMKMLGNQCLISFDAQAYYPDFTSDGKAKTDDWLISPRIAGGSHLRFYAKPIVGSSGQEQLEVLVSYGSARPEDFGLLASETLTGTSQQRFDYDLPADARYFAIRNVTEGGFVLMIDNISYTPGFTDLELMGYNVYRDGVKLNGEPVETLTFTDNSAEAGGCYGVTAVYDFDGESAMVTAQSTLGIGTMRDEQCTMNNGRYYDLQGRRLQTTPRRGVYMLKQGQSVKKVIGE